MWVPSCSHAHDELVEHLVNEIKFLKNCVFTFFVPNNHTSYFCCGSLLFFTSVVVPYCYLFLLSVFILWFSYYVSDIFCKF